MKWWALFKQFPKFVLVAGIIVGSTVLFVGWWFVHSHARPRSTPRDIAAEQAAIRERAAKAEARIDYLFLADNDLYDAGTSECLFKNWLHGDHPVKLFYDQASKKIIGQYKEGFARYAFDGSRETVMMKQEPPAFVPGSKRIVFVRDKNIWVATADWQNFRFINERQVTTIGVFYEQHFAENVQLLTAKTLIVRNLNNLLRVDLESSKVKPSRLPLGEIGKRRSPDSEWVVGVLNGQFYCYDVDTDESKTIQVGRNGISDYQWLGNDRCVALAAGKAIVAYDRLKHNLTEVRALPFPCFKMGEPSPDGRFIFCAGGIDGRNGALVDLEKKAAVRVTGGAGIAWVSNDTFAYSSNVPDSEQRGTWIQKVGERERRISAEPYLVGSGGPQLMELPSASLVILETPHGLMKMRRNDTSTEELLKLPHPLGRVMRIQEWKVE